MQQHEAFLFSHALQTTEYLKPGMSFKSVRPPRSSALVRPRASKEMKDPKEKDGSEGVLKGIKKPKDGSEGGSGGKMMGQMAPKDGPEILQAGRGIRRGEEGQC